jgi:predicted acetyltransferase
VVVIREFVPDDLDDVWPIKRLAFGGQREPDSRWLLGGWRGWVASLNGRPCGFARAWPYRQFFGGAAVPMAGLASVSVDPYARGRGVATALLDAALPVMRERGQVLSALYPSVAGLYRGRGWEWVGVNERFALPTAALRSIAPCLSKPQSVEPWSVESQSVEPWFFESQSVELRPAGLTDLAALHECYLALASTVDGMLDRDTEPFDVSRVLELDIVTVAPGPSGLRGYVSGGRTDSGLMLYDLVALDAGACRALLRSVGSWAGQLDTVSIRVLDSRLLSPVGQGIELHSEPWMLRVVDFQGAVAARGWPRAGLLRPGLSVDVELVDPHAPWHGGRHRIVVDGGRVIIAPGGRGTVRLTAQGLAAWYAGAADSAALRRAGQLDGDAAASAVLDALTGAPGTPRLADSF